MNRRLAHLTKYWCEGGTGLRLCPLLLVLTYKWGNANLIAALGTLENPFRLVQVPGLNRVMRLIVGTWEGDINSFSSNMLNAVARLVTAFGDDMNDEIFKDRMGNISVKQLIRAAKDRRSGSAGLAETMLIEYNGKRKNPAGKLSVSKLRSMEYTFFRKHGDTHAPTIEAQTAVEGQTL